MGDLTRRTGALSNMVMGATVVLAAVGLVLLQVLTPHAHMHLFAAAICVGVGMLGPVVVVISYFVPYLKEHVNLLTAIIAVAQLVFLVGLVANTNGVRGPMWIVFVPLAIITSIDGNKTRALLLNVVDAAAFLGSSALAGAFSSQDAVPLVVGSMLIVIVGTAAATVAGFLYELLEEVHAEREELDSHVVRVSGVLSRAAAGDLDARVDIEAEHKHLHILADGFNATLSSLRTLVVQVRDGGEQIATSASDLLVTAEEHAASASQQSAAVTETRMTIEELAATAAQIAETSESVARYAAEMLRNADEGREAVATSVESMDAIAVRVEAIASRALVLGERSQEIGRIIEVIDELADQTNLLALNAAIEAARAGEHGRGFSVVASEIRKLAERAQESTGQIKSLVREIQAETQSTIIASEEGAKEVRTGSERAHGVVEALERIGGMVEETTSAAREISIATQQQRSASDQVVAAMSQVSDVSRQYAVGSKQAAAAAAQLDVLSRELRDAISAFAVS